MPRTRSESETSILTERRPLALAHRGARLEAPENTLSAFELALEHGCDGFECDLRATIDGEIMLCHDPDFRGRDISNSTYAEVAATSESRMLDPPTLLQDVLGRFAGRAYIDLELKVTGMADRVLESLRGVDRERVLISSFIPEALDEVRARDASLRLGWICKDAHKLRAWQKTDCDTLVVHFSLAESETIAEMQAAGKRVLVWAAEQENEMELLVERDVEGIISDHTQLLAQTVRRTKAQAAALGR